MTDIFLLMYFAGMVISAVLLFTGKFPGRFYGADWNDGPEAVGACIVAWPLAFIISMFQYFMYGTIAAEDAFWEAEQEAEATDE